MIRKTWRNEAKDIQAISIVMPVPLLWALERVAERLGKNASDLARQGIQELIDRIDRKEQS